MMRETSCDAVMVGRGALGNPWIFNGIIQACSGEKENYLPSLDQRQKMIKNHWEMEIQFLGDKLADKRFRKHLLWYTRDWKAPAGLDNWQVNKGRRGYPQ